MGRWTYWFILFLFRLMMAFVGCIGAGLILFEPMFYVWHGHWTKIPLNIEYGIWVIGLAFLGVGFGTFWQLLHEPSWDESEWVILG